MNENTMQDAHALLDARADEAQPSRRTALKAAAGASFAAAVMPIAAQTVVTTPSDGLLAGAVQIDVNGFALPAYRAAPVGVKNAPVVLVVPEIFGLHAHIADVARRLARLGYLAIAPDLMARQGDATQIADMAQLMANIVSKVPDAQVMADLDATVAWAARNGGDSDRLAITGFCWGGRITWLYTAHQPKVKAGVAWYGRLVGQSSPLTPVHPVDVAAKLKAPVLGLYGGADTGIPLATVDAMKAALDSAPAPAKSSQFVVYPDTPHAFHADYRPSFRKEAAQDGWQRLTQWLKQNGV
ncbi:MAG: dienelactone hydrolase family protein [Rhodoferax sp.]|nr:dienelactone hydrolase family protein [Rhodoferax sp.]